ncbi:MAG: phosphate signaling complex protein PhoU [Terriglobia bacterium]
MRKPFHSELKDLEAEIQKIGELVEEALVKSVKSIVEGDTELADQVVDGDDAIDKLTVDLEEQAMAIQARQSPVAKDLRLIYSTQFIAIHLERMGDLCLNLAAIAKRAVGAPPIPTLFTLLDKMGQLTLNLIEKSLEAFGDKDLELARKLGKMDEPIDDLFKEFFKELTRVSEDESSFDWASQMVLANRYLERIADHAVDIGERVAFVVTGEIQEFD